MSKQYYQDDKSSLHIEPYPIGYEEQFVTIFIPGTLNFIVEIVRQFKDDIKELYQRRAQRKIKLQDPSYYPTFPSETEHIRKDSSWKVDPPPKRATCRKIDCGDVSPAKYDHFKKALNSGADGIQTDFDDGHCPTWTAQLCAYYNVYCAAHGVMRDIPPIQDAPILMLRPRAWNMIDPMISVDGESVPGALLDFAVLMVHIGKRLSYCESGPFFYLSKLEGYLEARLWNKIFDWTEKRFDLEPGTIRACVLIENIHAAFEMEEILYELRTHSLGLNCGIWDYCASIISSFGSRKEFLIPDRSKYVNMNQHFLKSYMEKLIEVCHRRGAFATGGMNAKISSEDEQLNNSIVEAVCSSKEVEVVAGIDGFMVYDMSFIPALRTMFNKHVPGPNQLQFVKELEKEVEPADLLAIPQGDVTMNGLRNNISIGIEFIFNWLNGEGVFIHGGNVEDSATAEISRSQVWQWLRHQVKLETGVKIDRPMIYRIIIQYIQQFRKSCKEEERRDRFKNAAEIFCEIVTKRDFPEFITTYLSEEHEWRKLHAIGVTHKRKADRADSH